MPFDYDEIKNQDGGTNWTSYSDLFMLLSLVFLMLYVVAQLRSGTFSIQKHLEYQRLAHEARDLRQQIKVYNTLKEDYLQQGATEGERALHAKLMDKLSLLKDEAQEEQLLLEKQLLRNNEKKEALNEYQQIIRNIVNANLLAKTQIKRRDAIIKKKEGILSKTRGKVRKLERTVAEKKKVIEEGSKQVRRVRSQLKNKVAQLRTAYKQQKISKKKRDQLIAKIRKESQKELTQLEKKTKTISKQLSKASGQLAVAQKELKEKSLEAQRKEKEIEAFRARVKSKTQNLNAEIARLGAEVQTTATQLKEAKALVNARKELAKRIARAFKKADIRGEVNPETGDVTLTFGDEYFDTDKADLKKGMERILKRFIPVYATSLFDDKKLAAKVDAVEVIGFASPTYQGKYVDPKSLDSKDRRAVKYNLDLSYRRARSIFSFIFDTDKMTYRNQQRLFSIVKVTGRSFIASGNKGRKISSGISRREFCAKFDCLKEQKVIIRFNLND